MKLDELIEETYIHQSEDERKNSLVNEGKELAARLLGYGLDEPQTRISSGKYASEVLWVYPLSFHIGLWHGVLTNEGLAEIPLSDLERMIKDGRRRLSNVEGDIDEALQKFPSETSEGRMEGKNNEEILEMIASARLQDLRAHFDFLKSAPTSIKFHDRYANSHVDLSVDASPPYIFMKNERLNKARNRSIQNAQFLINFEGIDSFISQRASELKLALER